MIPAAFVRDEILALASDQVIGAPDNVYSMLGVIGAAFFGALVFAVAKPLVQKIFQRPQTIEANGQTVDVSGESRVLVGLLADQQERLEGLEHQIDSLRTVNAGLSHHVVVLKAWTGEAIAWIDRGAPPPPLEVPQDVRQVQISPHPTEP